MNAIIETRKVDAPLKSWSQFLHELQQQNPYAGKETVAINLVTLLGGFARFRGNDAQNDVIFRGMRTLFEG